MVRASKLLGNLYKPIIDGYFDFKTIGPLSAGSSILEGRPWIKYGIMGVAGMHDNGNYQLAPAIGGNIRRNGNTFDVTLMLIQKPLAGSPAWDWIVSKSPEKDKFQDFNNYGLKVTFDGLLESVKSLIPKDEIGKYGVRETILRSEDDIALFAATELHRRATELFTTFPSVTQYTRDAYYMMAFTNSNINPSFECDSFSTKGRIITNPTATTPTESDFKFTGVCSIDWPTNIEKTYALYRQNKAMWSFFEHLFAINENCAVLDYLYLSNQFSAAKSFTQFIFDQLTSFDQRPFVSGLDLQTFITIQMLRLSAFAFINEKIPIDKWTHETKATLKHPGISDSDFEKQLAMYDKYWQTGTFGRVGVIGEGAIKLNLLPFGNYEESTKINGFSTAVPTLRCVELANSLEPNSFKQEDQHLDLIMTPNLTSCGKSTVVSYDRSYGISGISTQEATIIGINVITPCSVKRICPVSRAGEQIMDRIDPGLWPILVQIKEDILGIELKMFGKDGLPANGNEDNKGDVARYAIGLASVFTGPYYYFDPLSLASKSNVLKATKDTINLISLYPKKKIEVNVIEEAK